MNEEDIPIDIHYNKLLDWLVSRHHCKQQWPASALLIREKINNAIQDMPEHNEITELLKGTYINYFHCLRIVEILKETEAASKNLFGRYSSQRMKDWLEIVKLYEENGVYLGEAAQMLIRNVNYELPALKKQITKSKQAQTDCSRKEGEYASQSAELKEKYHKQCKHMGIQGNKIKSELIELVKDLPKSYNEIAEAAKELQPAIDYYKVFTKFLLAREDVPGGDFVPHLQYIITHGNTTTFEYRTGTAPTKVEENTLRFSGFDDEETATADDGEAAEIDWGAIDADGIDFGDQGAADTIDFGDGDGAEIDWGNDGNVDIAIVDDSTGNVTIETSGDDGVARGTDALTVLDNIEFRNNFLNELMELDAFLSHRITELSDSSDIVSGATFSSAPTNVQITKEKVQPMSTCCNRLLERLTNERMKELMLIRSSPRYVERIAEKLKKNVSDSEKMMSLSRLMVIRREEARQEEVDTQPKVALIRERTLQLKTQIEKEISKKYKERRVNIMGEVNTV